MEQSVITEIETLAQQFVPTLAGYVATKATPDADSAAVSAAASKIISGIVDLEAALHAKKAA